MKRICLTTFACYLGLLGWFACTYNPNFDIKFVNQTMHPVYIATEVTSGSNRSKSELEVTRSTEVKPGETKVIPLFYKEINRYNKYNIGVTPDPSQDPETWMTLTYKEISQYSKNHLPFVIGTDSELTKG